MNDAALLKALAKHDTLKPVLVGPVVSLGPYREWKEFRDGLLRKLRSLRTMPPSPPPGPAPRRGPRANFRMRLP